MARFYVGSFTNQHAASKFYTRIKFSGIPLRLHRCVILLFLQNDGGDGAAVASN